MQRSILFFLLAILTVNGGCNDRKAVTIQSVKPVAKKLSYRDFTILPHKKSGVRTIHVFVALCDNKYQGIVPVPAAIGNGQDANHNLYWGAGNGIKSYSSKSAEWELIKVYTRPSDLIIERILFRHKSANVYLLAEAYDGQYIKQTTIDFLNSLAGNFNTRIITGRDTICFGGNSDLCAYIGHDGLMDFKLVQQFNANDNYRREAIILACYSKSYFTPFIKQAKASPLLWTNGLMAPEAYTLHDALNVWTKKENPELIRSAAAKAYSKYQRCTMKAALNLLATGW